MVDIEYLRKLQAEAKRTADELGLIVKELNDRELKKFGKSFERMLVLAYPQREIVDIFLRHQGEILLGAMVAKAQFDSEFDGEQPSAGKFGMTVIRACYLGIGDDWEDAAPFTTGSPQNWIHSGTSLLGGTAGNPIRIGENIVHVVIGIGSLHPSPKIESIKFEIDGKEKPVLTLGYQLKKSDLKVRELDSSLIWKKDTTVLAKVFISAKYGSSVDDYPYLLGVSYLRENVMRVHDPASVVLSVNKVVATT